VNISKAVMCTLAVMFFMIVCLIFPPFLLFVIIGGIGWIFWLLFDTNDRAKRDD